jgi:hypothetical protein
MERSDNSGKRRIKRVRLGHKGGKEGSILEQSSKYTPVLRARGVLNSVSFFLLIIGFKEFK